MIEKFDVQKETEKAKQLTKAIRKPRFYRSRLDDHSDTLIALHRAGNTAAQIHRFLVKEKKVNVAWSTVYRWVKKNG
ncbi:hypothetical protein AMBLS11_01140 [Alteromonas macleodii str. 'Black Sea 11']|nr:hypothetical protein AMBLS11_01140 [Alteromonas macleodii str. 'Black Sea 11']